MNIQQPLFDINSFTSNQVCDFASDLVSQESGIMYLRLTESCCCCWQHFLIAREYCTCILVSYNHHAITGDK